jgi:hypothetical protein
MSAGNDFVATYPDGARRIFANVGNPASFRKTMTAIGCRVTSASQADFKTAGVEDGGAQIGAVASLQIVAMPTTTPPGPYIAGHPQPEPKQPQRASLAALMRKQCGLQTEEEKAAEQAKRGSLAKSMDAILAKRARR